MALEVPGYHLRGCLARSGVASVHRAEAVGRPGRLLVVEHLQTRPDPASLAAVRHVAEVLGELDHPAVLPLLDVVDTGSGIALVMPFTPGGSLAEAIERTPAGLPPAMIAEVGTRIADGLAALHEHGLVHGAITARSVRFDVRGRPLLADTGTALLHGGVPPRTVPPSRDQPSSPAAHGVAGDLRALGAVLAAALAGSGAGAEGAGDPAGETAAAGGSATTPGPDRPPVDVGVVRRVRATIAARAHDVAAAAGRRRGRWPRLALVAAAALVLLVPVVLAATAIDDQATIVASPEPTPPGLSGPPDPPAPATGLEPGAPAARDTEPAPPGTAPMRPRRPPPLCPGLGPPTGDGAVFLADLDGRGCSAPVRWDGRELTVATTRAAPHRYELLADDGDQLLFGDVHCDGRDAPVLYRPRTGEVFVFDGLVAPGEEITVTGEPSGRVGGRATIVTDDTGCDRLRIDEQR